MFLGDTTDAAGDGTIIGSAWIFSDSQSQDRAALGALDERLQHAPVKIIVFSHSGLLTNGLAPLDAFAHVHR